MSFGDSVRVLETSISQPCAHWFTPASRTDTAFSRSGGGLSPG
jgi:hypothetical protein